MRYQEKKYKSLRYIERLPDSYNGEDLLPTIIFLHGAGTVGSDINLLTSNPYFTSTDSLDFPFATVTEPVMIFEPLLAAIIITGVLGSDTGVVSGSDVDVFWVSGSGVVGGVGV